MSRWTEGLPPYEALVERCTGLCRDEMIGAGYLEYGIRADLDEVFRTLETVTPEMKKGGYDGPVAVGNQYASDWLCMLRASPLAKPKEDGP